MKPAPGAVPGPVFYAGTGLSLSISGRVCRMMGGDIRATSPVGDGLTFTASLPADVSAGQALVATEATSEFTVESAG